MKLISALFLASFVTLQGHAIPAPVEVERRSAQTCGFPTVALLRAYNSQWHDHFYTANATEMEESIVSFGYTSEGDAAQVLPSPAPNTVPLYRLVITAGGDHTYTTSAAERDSFVEHGYTYEGITAYVYPSNLCGTVPLFRMNNPQVRDHFYTTNAAERDNMITQHNYVDEGIAAFVNPQ